MNYFKDKARKGVKLRRELAISSVLSVWIIVSAIWPFPPLSYLLDFNEFVKDSWIVQDDFEPPFGHAEMLSLKVFTKKMSINLKDATRELKANGIVFESTEETIEDIGKNNNISPMNIYMLIKKFEPSPEPEKLETYTPESIEVEFSGTGFGRKSIRSICAQLGLDTTVAIARLTSAGFPSNLDLTMKAAAEEIDTEAIEIMKVLLIDGYKPELDED